MRIILLSIIWIALTDLTAGAQSSKRDSSSLFVLTCDANQNWLDSLQHQPLDAQLRMIWNRAIADTNIVITTTEQLIFVPDRQTGCCKPQIYLNGYYVNFDYQRPGPDLERFLKTLDAVHVNAISIWHSGSGEQLNVHGNYAKCGIIQMTAKDKQSKRIIKEAYKR